MTSLAPDVQTRLRAAFDARLGAAAATAGLPVRWPNTRGGPPPAAGVWLVPSPGPMEAAIAGTGGHAALTGRQTVEAVATPGTGMAALDAAADVVLAAFPPGTVLEAGGGVVAGLTGLSRAALTLDADGARLTLAVFWRIDGA
ncbi:phage tail terminator-like protein [Tistrella mobilis]|uniref:phage tail terminator-like protein n=1 Tax=Tistrella mobilis TaxID=171437 RepID=UPI00355729ED